MSIALPYRFMLAAIFFVVLGMLLGLYMGPSGDFTLVPVHAHLNLAGWATMMLFGLYYRSDPVTAGQPIARWHFWVAFVGMLIFAPGIAGANLGNALEVLIIPGALLTLVSMLMFAWVVWQASQRKA